MRLSAAPLRELPPVTRWLVGACFAGWLANLFFGFGLSVRLGLVPRLFLGELWLWQAVTYLFLHAGFLHFLFNAFMLWMLGRIIEPEMGSRRFLIYFVGCGVAAALLTAVVQPNSVIPVVGASGAVYALLGAFAFMFPNATVYLYFLFPVSARTMAILLGGMEFLMSISHANSKISSITHLGGLIAGLAWLWWERRRRLAPVRYVPEPDPETLEQAEIDRLLEKISRRGQGALSRSELEKLDEYARRRGGRA